MSEFLIAIIVGGIIAAIGEIGYQIEKNNKEDAE